MDFSAFSALLKQSFEQNKLTPATEQQTTQFYDLTLHLLKVNAHTNLTAIRDVEGVISKHLTDSCLAAAYFPANAKVLDIGCGAGFPTLPLAIYRPDLRITALDSTDKKVRFVAEAAALLGLSSVTTVTGRAEDRTLIQRIAPFDAVTSRAVSRLCVLAELSMPYAAIGGQLVLLKGADGEAELKEAEKGLRTLGGDTPQLDALTLTLLDGSTEQRSIITVKKSAKTQPIYPRAYAAIKKSPLL